MNEVFEASLYALLERLDPASTHQGQQDIAAIQRAGATSYQDLLAILADTQASTDLRATVCWVLGRLSEKQAEPNLLAVLTEQSPLLRRAAVLALGELDDKRAVQPLILALLTDTDTEVRKAAAYALSLLGNQEALEPLRCTLSNQQEEPSVRGMAAEALANFRDTQASPVLLAALRDVSVEVRFWAAFALGELGDPQAVPEVKRVATTDRGSLPGWGTVEKEATEAIERIQMKLARAPGK